MPDLKLDIVVVPTFSVLTLAVVDASTYTTEPPVVVDPTLIVDVPGFDSVSIPFTVQSINILTSSILEITEEGCNQELPDGIYRFKYTIDPEETNYVERSIMRVDKLQEKFDTAFMKLDMMECDRAIKIQAKSELNSIYFFIQGGIAAANNCADIEAMTLYRQADNMLNTFIRNNCGCTGTNY